MIQLRPANDRGHANHGWLDSYHTFSFGDYYDPEHMGFASLRVINEDRVQPGAGFAPHSHRDMEIISYVLDGTLQHKDSLGNGSVIRPGDVQHMSAGTGVRHSEYNPSTSDVVHFLQIWILPGQTGLAPSYEQRHFDATALRNRWRLIASPDGRDGSVTVHQDALVYAAKLESAQELRHRLGGRMAYLHVARGAVAVNGHPLAAGDGAGVADESEIRVSSSTDGEVLLFDLA